MKHFFLLTKYTLIGGVAAILDILILYILVDILEVYYLSSAAISFTVATVFAFVFQKRLTFRDKSPEVSKQLTYFFLIAVGGMGLYVGIIAFFVSVLSLWYLLAAIISKVICFVWNFSLNYSVTFSVEIT